MHRRFVRLLREQSGVVEREIFHRQCSTASAAGALNDERLSYDISRNGDQIAKDLASFGEGERSRTDSDFRSAPPGTAVVEHPLILKEFKQVVGSRRASSRAKDLCAQQAMPLVAHFGPWEVANIFNCCKRGNYVNKGLFEALSKHAMVSDDLCRYFGSIQLSMLLNALGTAYRDGHHFPSLRPFLLRLVGVALDREGKGEQEFNEQSIANVVHALGLVFKRSGGVKTIPDEVKRLVDVIVGKLVETRRIERCTSQGLSILLHGFANLGYKDKDALRIICSEIQERISEDRADGFSNQDVSLMTWSLCKLGYGHIGALGALTNLARAQFKEMNAQNLSNMMYGLGNLQYDDLFFLRDLLEEITRPERLREYRTQHLSNILYSLAQLKNDEVRMDKHLVKLCKEVQQRRNLAAFSEQHIANIVFALGQMMYRNDEVLGVLSKEIARGNRVVEFTSQGLSNIVYGFGRLEYKNDAAFDALAEEICSPRRLAYTLKEEDFSRIIYGFGRVQYTNKNAIRDLIREVTKPERLERFCEVGLSNLVYGFGRLGYYEPSVFNVVFKHKRGILEGVREHALGNILQGVACLKDMMDQNFTHEKILPLFEQAVMHAASQVRLARFTCSEIADMSWAFSHVQFYNGTVMDRLIHKFLSLSSLENGFATGELFKVLVACGKLNHRNERFLDFVDEWLDSNISLLSNKETIIDIAWSLSILDRLSEERFSGLCLLLTNALQEERSSSAPTNADFNMGAWTKFMRTCGHMLLDEDFSFSQELTEFVSGGLERRRQVLGERAPTTFESEIKEALETLQVDMECNKEVLNGFLVADFVVNGQPKVVIEVWDAGCYTLNKVRGKARMVGDPTLRSRLFDKAGFKVLHIPWHTWHQLYDDERADWLQDALEKARTGTDNSEDQEVAQKLPPVAWGPAEKVPS